MGMNYDKPMRVHLKRCNLFFLFMFIQCLQSLYAHSQDTSKLLMPALTVYFSSGEWRLSKAHIENMDTYIIWNLKHTMDTNYVIHIEGHTDDIGDPESNIELSKKRANAVMEIFEKNGIPLHRIRTAFYGEGLPEKRKIAISKKREDIRYANRRVVIRIERAG